MEKYRVVLVHGIIPCCDHDGRSALVKNEHSGFSPEGRQASSKYILADPLEGRSMEVLDFLAYSSSTEIVHDSHMFRVRNLTNSFKKEADKVTAEKHGVMGK